MSRLIYPRNTQSPSDNRDWYSVQERSGVFYALGAVPGYQNKLFSSSNGVQWTEIQTPFYPQALYVSPSGLYIQNGNDFKYSNNAQTWDDFAVSESEVYLFATTGARDYFLTQAGEIYYSLSGYAADLLQSIPLAYRQTPSLAANETSIFFSNTTGFYKRNISVGNQNFTLIRNGALLSFFVYNETIAANYSGGFSLSLNEGANWTNFTNAGRVVAILEDGIYIQDPAGYILKSDNQGATFTRFIEGIQPQIDSFSSHQSWRYVFTADTDIKSTQGHFTRLTPVGATPAFVSIAPATPSGQTASNFLAANSFGDTDPQSLPAWLSLDAQTGVLSGTPPAVGNFEINILATVGTQNSHDRFYLKIGLGLAALTPGQTLTAKINQPLTSGTLTTVDPSNRPVDEWRSVGIYASGNIQLDSENGVFTGTPTQLGTSQAKVVLVNEAGENEQNFTLLVTADPPLIQESMTFDATYGELFSRTLIALQTSTRPVTNWSVTGLPAWASLVGGQIQGTPNSRASSTISITATGPGGTDTKQFTLSVKVGVPIIAENQSFTVELNTPFEFQLQLVDAANRPPQIIELVDPVPGVGVDSTGRLYGTLATKQTFNISIRPENSTGVGLARTVTLLCVGGLPLIQSSQILYASVGTPVNFSIALVDRANRPAVSWQNTGLPAGLSTTSSGRITGTPTTAGRFTAALKAIGDNPASIATGSLLVIVRSKKTIFGGHDPVPTSKTMRSFPSGLLLVQQQFLVRKENEVAAREIFANGKELPTESNAIDGVYIFTEPDFRQLDTGFVEINVTAYGRVNATGTSSKILVNGTVEKFIGSATTAAQTFESFNESVTQSFVAPTGSYPTLSKVSSLNVFVKQPAFNTSALALKTLREEFGANATITVTSEITRIDQVNYGFFSEYTITHTANARVQV